MLTLVTGSTGFIGSHLCRALLEAGHQVRAFHRTTSSLKLLAGLDIERAVGDITAPETLAAAMQGVEAVFHAASKVDYWRGTDSMYKVTVGGTHNVLQAALNAGVQRVVYTSSAASLGMPETPRRGRVPPGGDAARTLPQPINENHVWNYRPKWWRYGHAKHLAEKEVQKAVARGLDVVVANPSMVLGSGDANRISGELVIQVAREVIRFGIPGGMNAIHIDDVVRGHILALEHGHTGERYILGGENLTYMSLLQTIAEIAGVRPPKRTIPAWLLRPLGTPLDVLCTVIPMPFNGDLLRFSGRFLYYDTKKAQQVLGLTETRPVRVAVQESYAWYRERGMV